jgi:hypothetical protein
LKGVAIQTIRTWDDLSPYGIVPLVDQPCALSYRILCDLTTRGKRTLERAFSVKELILDAPRQPGSAEEQHVGSIMLAPGMLSFLALFCLLESWAYEVFLITDHRMTGFHQCDLPELKPSFENWYRDEIVSHFECSCTARERNYHYRLDRTA